jgi:hypothetical protein
MSADSANALTQLEGPSEGTQAHQDLETKVGFGYYQLLGELVYAYVLCQLDVAFAFALTLLSYFASAPAREHYIALKNITKYL